MKQEAFRGQVVIVTGALAGIGKSLAIQLAGQGAKVAIAAWRGHRLCQLNICSTVTRITLSRYWR